MAAASAEPKVPAVCVLRGFELSAWLKETYVFSHRVGGEAAAAWRQDVTRTVLLAGNPASLCERSDFDHVADDGSTACLGPASAEQNTALRRLLKLFPTTAPLPAVSGTVVELPADGAADGPAAGRVPVPRELHLATARLTIAECLVPLHHLLSEAAIDGLLGPGDRLTLQPAPRLVGVPGPFAALRIGPSHQRSHHVRAYAAHGAGGTL